MMVQASGCCLLTSAGRQRQNGRGPALLMMVIHVGTSDMQSVGNWLPEMATAKEDQRPSC